MHSPLVLLQVKQLALQAVQISIPPNEKVLLAQVSQAKPFIWCPAKQLLNTPVIPEQLRQLISQAMQECPSVEYVVLLQILQEELKCSYPIKQ